jgi:phosphoglycerate kinase
MLAKAEEKGLAFKLPTDFVAARQIAEDAEAHVVGRTEIPASEMGLDIGPTTIELYKEVIRKAKTIFWNGPMGVFEIAPWNEGTLAIARAVAEATGRGATSVVGGGDSVAALHAAGAADRVTHVSTGGGASLEFLEGRDLPGISALR